MARVVIIGGGISGLSAAYYLQEEFGDTDFLLVEGASELGGTLGSENVDGFTFERRLCPLFRGAELDSISTSPSSSSL